MHHHLNTGNHFQTNKMEKKIDITEEDVDKLMKVFAELNSTNVWSRVKRDDFTIRRFAWVVFRCLRFLPFFLL